MGPLCDARAISGRIHLPGLCAEVSGDPPEGHPLQHVGLSGPDASVPTNLEDDYSHVRQESGQDDAEDDEPEDFAAKVLAVIKADADLKAANDADFQKRLEDEKKKWAAELPAWQGGFNVIDSDNRGSDDDTGTKAYFHMLRTGDNVPYTKVFAEAAKEQLKSWDNDDEVKAALQGQTDAEGGYLVPDDFYNNVVAKRDDASVIRRAGATVIQTSLDRVLIPTEGTSMAKFAITAEEAAIDEDEPTFGQAVATVYKATKLVKLSEELMADEKANLQPFLGNAFGRAEAEWENYYFVSTGTGSSQPKAALQESGLGMTAAGTNAITAAEVNSLIYSLGGPYASSSSAALVAIDREYPESHREYRSSVRC